MIGADQRTLNKGAVMRRLLFAVALIGLASEAYAGDFETPMFGGSTSTDWYNTGQLDFPFQPTPRVSSASSKSCEATSGMNNPSSRI